MQVPFNAQMKLLYIVIHQLMSLPYFTNIPITDTLDIVREYLTTWTILSNYQITAWNPPTLKPGPILRAQTRWALMGYQSCLPLPIFMTHFKQKATVIHLPQTHLHIPICRQCLCDMATQERHSTRVLPTH